MIKYKVKLRKDKIYWCTNNMFDPFGEHKMFSTYTEAWKCKMGVAYPYLIDVEEWWFVDNVWTKKEEL